MSLICRTFNRFPLGGFGGGRGLGFGVANQSVIFRGTVGGTGHNFTRLQIS